MNLNPVFVDYDNTFLAKSWLWLNDPEIKKLTLTPDFSQDDQKDWFEKLPQKSDYLIWGVKINDEPIGVCGIKNLTEKEGEYWGYIGEKQFWNKGIGSKILDHIFVECKKRNIEYIFLKVWNQNLRALKLYEKYGFKIYQEAGETILMRKKSGLSSMFKVKQYNNQLAGQWNNFIMSSRNGNFLFHRNYMDYHADRFDDFSIMIYDQHEKLIAVVPGNRQESTFYTHQGLTYGGIITLPDTSTKEHLQLNDAFNHYLKLNNIHKVVFKKIPYIYANQPIDEELYLLFRNHARMIGCNISTTLALQQPFTLHRSRRSAINKSKKQELEICKNISWIAFWELLTLNLKEKYGTFPVHSLDEILKLHRLFPTNIHLYTAEKENTCLGGVVIYESPQVAHAQYMSVSAEGKASCALDLILNHLITEEFKHKNYFDFGSSTENQGHFLNESLIFQKEGFGGKGVCYQIFEYDI